MDARATSPSYADRYWSHDGVRLHYCDYPGREDRPAVLCLAGLTRNARDFAPLAKRLAGDWRVIALNLRGRGGSEAARDAMSYVPLTYAADVAALIDELELARPVVIGTSLGGLIAMLLAAGGVRFSAVVLNDVGPVLEPAGLARIRSYVGRASNFPTWLHAARALADTNADVYPDWQLADWLAMAKRLYRLTGAGRIVLDYDLRIGEPFKVEGREAAADLWAMLDTLGATPTLVVRGARSDLLSEATAAAMAARLPDARLAVVPGVGHAPVLDEPEAAAAIDALLARIADPAAVRELTVASGARGNG